MATMTEPRGLAWEQLARAKTHPLQIRILDYMADGRKASPSEMHRDIGGEHSLSAFSYHVSQLRAAGLLKPAGQRPRRGAIEHFYTLAAKALER